MDGARNEEDFMHQQELQQQARPPENQAAAAAHVHYQTPSPASNCPRCYSPNTKFCYYNNYSLSQPRYWTRGGTLRDVPIGGGSRKSKRPRISPPPPPFLSSPNALITQRTQGFPAAAPQNMAGMIYGQTSRQAATPQCGAFDGGGSSFLSSLAAMQSPTTAGISHGAAAASGGSGFGSNMALLQEMQSPAPPRTHFFPPQRNLIPPGTFCSSAAGDEVGSSFTPKRWSDCDQGFK